MPTPMRRFLFLIVAVAATPLFGRSFGDFDVRPAPAWIDRVALDYRTQPQGANVRKGVWAILTDHQVRVASDGHFSEYFRRVRKVVSSNGVQNASELNLDFDPSYQRLVIHEAALVRDGRRIEQLDPAEVRVIEKEPESDEKIYDGMLTALLFLKDVRPGDVIDYSFSLDGSNPLLGGKYADEFDVAANVPTQRIRHRLIWPADRPYHFRSTIRGFAPAVETRGSEKIAVWDRRDVAGVEVEDQTPDWFDPYDSVQVTEYGSWAEVGAWANELFQPNEASVTAVRNLAAKIRGEHASRDEQVTAAIRFVQDDIRYLGIEMGRNSHQPHAPAVTLQQRYGDCKDKAFLLAMLLRELGLEAYPAMVNTRIRHRLDDLLPSPFLFDHVITEVIAGGKTYWVDATSSDEGGTLQTLDTPNDERALVVRAGTTALTRIDVRDAAAINIEQTYTTRDYSGPTTLQVKTTYSGAQADRMRSKIGSMSIADLAKERINRYAEDQPKIVANRQPVILDDRLRNVITILETYTIRDLWRSGEWTFYPRQLENHLSRPETMIRSMPLAVDYPLNLTQKMTFNLPEHLSVNPAHDVVETPVLRYEGTADSNGDTVVVTRSLRIRRDSVAVADVPDHLSKLNEIMDQVGFNLAPHHEATAAAAIQSMSPKQKWTTGGGVLAGFVGFMTYVALRRARARRRLIRIRAFRRGEAPASAVEVREPAEIHARLPEFACPCGAAITAPGEISRARYDDRDLTIVTRNCPRCGREQSLYFRLLTAGAA